MHIGIVGIGGVGRTLGTIWARAGHEVAFGSRDPVRATEVASGLASARATTQEEAAAFGEVVLWTPRGVMPTDPDMLAGKIVLDPNNREPGAVGVTLHRVARDQAWPSSSRRPRRRRAW